MASLNHGSIIGSIFGKGTVYENLDNEEEDSSHLNLHIERDHETGRSREANDHISFPGHGRGVQNPLLADSGGMNSESEDSDENEDPTDDILTEQHRSIMNPVSNRTRSFPNHEVDVLEEDDDEIPQSLMVEPTSMDDKIKHKFHRPTPTSSSHPRRVTSQNESDNSRLPMPPIISNNSHSVLPLYKKDLAVQDSISNALPPPVTGWMAARSAHNLMIDPKEKARWKWANVENLDIFLQEVSIHGL